LVLDVAAEAATHKNISSTVDEAARQFLETNGLSGIPDTTERRRV
jgi:hypothetical protein